MSQSPRLTVAITDRTLTRSLKFPAEMLFKVQRYSFSVDAGPKQCTIRVEGNELALRSLLDVLRGGVEISDGGAEPVWWGFLQSVVIYTGNLRYGRTLDGMANSVNIIYLLQSIAQSQSGAGSQATTGFFSDAASVTEYGTMEKRIRGNNGSVLAAIARQSLELANLKAPQLILETSDSLVQVPYAIITARGWMDTLDWRYYTNITGAAAGFEQNAVLTSMVQHKLNSGDVAKTTISFDANNLISDSMGQLSFDVNEFIYVTGSAANSAAARLVTVNGPGAGSTITVDPSTLTIEAAGPAVAIRRVGDKAWETFTLGSDAPFYAEVIDIQLSKAAGITDNVTVKLYSVSAGLPNVLLATGTILTINIPTYPSWVSAILDVAVSLVFGITYGILVESSGSQPFLVGLDTALSYAGGVLKLRAGATIGYVTRRPADADLIFRVAGTVETTTQINNIITGVGQFVPTCIVEDIAGLRTVPYQDGTLTALKVIYNLAAFGVTGGLRLLLRVTRERTLILYKEPTLGTDADFLIREDGRIRNSAGVELAGHRVPYGQWVKFAALEFFPNSERYVFIDEAEFDVTKNVWKIVRLRNRPNTLALTEIKQ